MVNKKDPICGMEGHIEAYGKYFCNKQHLREYAEKKDLEIPFTKSKGFDWLIYLVAALLLVGLVFFLRRTGFMILFMGVFFAIFAFLKFLDIKGFANAFAMYDIVAAKSKFYAFLYPFIELSISLAFLFNYLVFSAAVVLFIIMSVGAIGVTRNLMQKHPVKCACLGTKIKVPLTKFTLFEDVTMAVMALMILTGF